MKKLLFCDLKYVSSTFVLKVEQTCLPSHVIRSEVSRLKRRLFVLTWFIPLFKEREREIKKEREGERNKERERRREK